MLSVPIHKDFCEYKPKIVGTLSLRTLLCLGVGIVIAITVGCIATFVLRIDFSVVSPIVWMCMVPAAMVGFWSPHGMDFEKFLPLWLAHTTEDQLVLYAFATSRGALGEMRKRRKEQEDEKRKNLTNPYYEKVKQRKGIEGWDAGELPPIG